MEYNKTQFSKTSDKKVLHKVRKHWVVLSTALLMALGGGAALTGGTTSANADANANSNNNNTNASSTNTLKSRLNASLTKGYQANQANNTPKSVNVNQVSSKALTNQASALHNRILANATNASQNRQSTTNGRQASQNNGNNNEGAVLNNRIKASVNAPKVGAIYNAPRVGNPTHKYNNIKAPITVAYLNSDNTLQKRSDNGALDPRVEEQSVELAGDQYNQPTSLSDSLKFQAPSGYKIVNNPVYNFSLTSDDTDPYHWISDSANKDNNEAYQYVQTGTKQFTSKGLIVNGKNQVAYNTNTSSAVPVYKVLQSINSEGQPVTVNKTNSNGQTIYYKYSDGHVKSDINQIDNTWQPMPELATSGIGYTDGNNVINPSFNWDTINNRPLVLLKADPNASNGTSIGHDIILNYVNESGKSLNNKWGTKSPSDVIYGGESEPSGNQSDGKSYSTSNHNYYGDTINVLDAINNNLKTKYNSEYNNFENDYYFSTSDQKNVKKLYQFGNSEQNVTVPLTGRSFDSDVASDTTNDTGKNSYDHHANEQGNNKFTINVFLRDHEGQDDGSFTISKYLGGRIGKYIKVTPSDVAEWIHQYNSPSDENKNDSASHPATAQNHDNIYIHVTNGGSHHLSDSNLGKLEQVFKNDYSINPSAIKPTAQNHNVNDSDDSIYVKGNGNGVGLLVNSSSDSATTNDNNSRNFEFDANANDVSQNGLGGVKVHYIDQNNKDIKDYTIDKNTYMNKSDKPGQKLLGNSDDGYSFKYGSAINLANVITTQSGENSTNISNHDNYAQFGSDISVPQGYSLDPGQSTRYNLNSDEPDVYLYVNGNSVKPKNGDKNSFNYGKPLNIKRVEVFYGSNGKDPLPSGTVLKDNHGHPYTHNTSNGTSDVKVGKNGEVTVSDSLYSDAGIMGQTINLMADNYTPGETEGYTTDSDAVDPDTSASDWVNDGFQDPQHPNKTIVSQSDMSSVPVQFDASTKPGRYNSSAKNYSFDQANKSDSITFLYKVTTSTENATRYPVYFHYVTPSDQYDDVATQYNADGTPLSQPKDTTISDQGTIKDSFASDYESAVKNAPYGYQYVTTLGIGGKTAQSDDHTINNHFSSKPVYNSKMNSDINAIKVNSETQSNPNANGDQKQAASNKAASAKADLQNLKFQADPKGTNVVIEVAPVVQGAQIVYVDQNANDHFSDANGHDHKGKALNLTTNPTYIHGIDQNGVTRYGEQINLNNGSLVGNDNADNANINGKSDDIDGQKDDNDSAITNAHVPAGYHITEESGDVITLNKPGSNNKMPIYYVMVAGNTDDPTSSKYQTKIYIHEMDPKGQRVLHTYADTDDISGDIGDNYTVYASNFTPNGYSVDSKYPSSITGSITNDGVSPKTMDFYYTKNVDMNASDLQDIYVMYMDNGQEVGFNDIDPYKSDYEDKQIDISDGYNAPENSSKTVRQPAANQQFGYVLPPTPGSNGQQHYDLVPGQNTTTDFSDTHSNVLRLNVYDPANQVGANFTVYKHLVASDGHGNNNIDLHKILDQNVAEHGYKSDDVPSYDHSNYFQILASDFNNVDGYRETPSDFSHYSSDNGKGQLNGNNSDASKSYTGEFTNYGIKPAATNFDYVASNSSDDMVPKHPGHRVGPDNPLVPKHDGKGTNHAQNPSDNSGNNVVPTNPNEPISPDNPPKPNPNNSNPTPNNPSDVPGGHNVGPNEHVAMPIYVQYWASTGKSDSNHNPIMGKIGSDQRVDGYMGQFYSDITQHTTIPDHTQYHLVNGQNLSYTINGFEQQVNLDLAKTGKYDDTITVNLYKVDPSHKVLDNNRNNNRNFTNPDRNGSDTNTNISQEPVGQRTYTVSDNTSDTISPDLYHLSDFTPDNTLNANGGKGDVVSDRNGVLYVNGSKVNGSKTIGPDQVTGATNSDTVNYFYKAETRNSDADLGNINVNYVTVSGSVVSHKTFPATQGTNYKGEGVNVISDGDIPSGYQLDTDHSLNPNLSADNTKDIYYYNDEPQNVDVFVKGTQLSADPFDLSYTLIKADGSSDSGDDNQYANQSYSDGRGNLEPDLPSQSIGASDEIDPGIALNSLEHNHKFSGQYYVLSPASDASDVPVNVHFEKQDPRDNSKAVISPSDTHFTYVAKNTANNAAGPLIVHYKTASGTEPATAVINGKTLGTIVDDVTKNPVYIHGGLGSNYSIDPNQNLSYKFNNKGLANMNVYVHGKQKTASDLDVKRIEINVDGSTTVSDLPNQKITDNVGSDIKIYANNYIPGRNKKAPLGYSPSSNDVPAVVHMNPNGTLNPNMVAFVYDANQTTNAQPMVVRYWNEKGQYVGGNTIPGTGNFGKTINVTNSDAATNNGVAGVGIPVGYHLAADGPNSNPDQRTEYTFNGESRVINLNVEGLSTNPSDVPSDVIDNTSDNMVTVHLHENQGGKDIVLHVHDLKPVGDYTTYGPNDFARYVDGYHATLSDQDTNVYTKFDTNDHVLVKKSTAPGSKTANDKADAQGNVLQHDSKGNILYFKDTDTEKNDLNDKIDSTTASTTKHGAYQNTHKQYTIGRIFADPHDVYFNYDQNDAQAAPLKLIYVDQDGNQVGTTDTITGNLDQRVNVADPSDGGEAVPSGYTLDGGYVNKTAGQKPTSDIRYAATDNDVTDGKGQPDHSKVNAKIGANQRLNYGLTNQKQTVYLHVDGTPMNKRFPNGKGIKQMTINLIEHNADGSVNVKTTYYDPDFMKGNTAYYANGIIPNGLPKAGQYGGNNDKIGDHFEVTPSDALIAYDAQHMKADHKTPQSDAKNFHAAPSDADQFGWIQNDGSIMPSQMTFSYYAGGKTASDGVAVIHYYNVHTDAPVGTAQVKPGKLGSDIFGQNKTSSDKPADNDFPNMPMGYHTTDGFAQLQQKFTNSPQDIFIPVTGDAIPKNHNGNVTVYSIEKDTKGNILGAESHTVHIGSNIGDSQSINAYGTGSITGKTESDETSSFKPNGYHADPSDTSVNFNIDVNGNVEPSNKLTFNYTKNAAVPQIGQVTVHYYRTYKDGNGHTQASDVDQVTDHGVIGNVFDLTPYENDVPSELNNEYYNTNYVVEDPSKETSKNKTDSLVDGDGSIKAGNNSIKYVTNSNKNNRDIYIKVAPVDPNKTPNGAYVPNPSNPTNGSTPAPASRS